MTVPLAPYGLRIIAIAILTSLLLTVAAAFAVGWYGLFFLFPALFVAFFFRDPVRTPDESAPNAVLAPADGRIVAISAGSMPGSGAPATVVDIFLSVFDVHINRAPLGGGVTDIRYTSGMFLNALRSSAGEANENNLIILQVDDAGQIAVKQIAGVIARRIVCAVKPGDTVEAGQRLGMIMFGSRTQAFIPADAGFRPQVTVGQHVKAGKTVLGHVR